MYWNFANSSWLSLLITFNNNIRCIEICICFTCVFIDFTFNNNIRCIEIKVNVVEVICNSVFNNNIRCIEIYISDMVDYYASGLITT